MEISDLQIQHLLTWFEKFGRHALPWRLERTPYRVWVSEIMLQQTQVATVQAYFSRFLSAFPDVSALAEAEEETVLRQWEGLGYYRRARQMHAAAKIAAQRPDAAFPTTFEEVLALPGIGRYTAGAILSFALDERFPILEANTQRLFARLTALALPVSTAAAQKILWTTAENFVSEKTSHASPCAINTALMDLGNLICTPQNPQCDACPFFTECESRRTNAVERIPISVTKMKYETRKEAAVVIFRTPNETFSSEKSGKSEPEVCLLRYVEGEWWAGLWDFPRVQILTDSPETELTEYVERTTGLKIALKKSLSVHRHSVTKYRITLQTFSAQVLETSGELKSKTPSGGEIRWVPASAVDAFPLCSTGRKIAKEAL